MNEVLRTAVVFPCDKVSLLSALEFAKPGKNEPILIGQKEKMKTLVENTNYNLDNFEIVETQTAIEALKTSISLVQQGKANSIAKGNIDSGDFLQELMKREHKLIKRGEKVSHIILMYLPNLPNPLVMTDVAFPYANNSNRISKLGQNAVNFVRKHIQTVGEINVALITPTEKTRENIESTIIANDIISNNLITDAIVEKMAFDVVLDRECANIKGIKSKVSGNAHIAVFPSIDSANSTFKSLAWATKAKYVGMIAGFKIPVILTSRSHGRDTSFEFAYKMINEKQKRAF